MNEYKFKINGQEYNVSIDDIEGKDVQVSVNGVQFQVELEEDSAAKEVTNIPETAQKSVHNITSEAAASKVAGNRTIESPLPGVIISINVKVGDQVKVGQEVAVLEAMKMENSIESTYSGTVTAVHISTGDSVPEGAAIISLT